MKTESGAYINSRMRNFHVESKLMFNNGDMLWHIRPISAAMKNLYIERMRKVESGRKTVNNKYNFSWIVKSGG